MGLREIWDITLGYFVEWIPIIAVPVTLFALIDLWRTVRFDKELRAAREHERRHFDKILSGLVIGGEEIRSIEDIQVIRRKVLNEMQLSIEINAKTREELLHSLEEAKKEILLLREELDASRTKDSGDKS